MSALDKVLDWITESEANAAQFRADFTVIHRVSRSLSATDIEVLKSIHAQGLAANIAPSAEVMGMRSYGWSDRTSSEY